MERETSQCQWLTIIFSMGLDDNIDVDRAVYPGMLFDLSSQTGLKVHWDSRASVEGELTTRRDVEMSPTRAK